MKYTITELDSIIIINNLMENILNLSGEELYNKAKFYEKVKAYNNSAICMTMAANYKYHKAIDTIYSTNTYEKQDYNITKKFYIDTAHGDNSFSINILAYMYEFGLGVERDINLAVMLYKTAIEKGNFYSMTNLGYLYEYKKNKAIELLRLSIETCFINNISLNNISFVQAIDKLRCLDYNIATVDRIKDADLYLSKSKIKTISLLELMFDLDKYIIELLIVKYDSHKTIGKLKKTILDLETHILYSPGGEEFLKIKNEWEKNNTKKLK